MEEEYSFIVQARYGAARLPGKVMLPFFGQKTILDIQLENIINHFPDKQVILATSNAKADDIIADKYSANNKIKVFRGSESDVLARFINAATMFNVKNIVRVCADNPFLSMPHIAELVKSYFENNPDYISYGFKDGTPSIRSHVGLFVEMVSMKALEKANSLTNESFFHEHVTNYIYGNADKFNVKFVPVPSILEGYLDKLRLTIDTMTDFRHLQKLYIAVLAKHGAEYTLEQLVEEAEKDVELMNSMKEQIKQHAK